MIRLRQELAKYVDLQPAGDRLCCHRDLSDPAPDIVVVTSKIDARALGRLTRAFFEDMVTYVVDIERGTPPLIGASEVPKDPR
jgi:hypothetical protein